MSNRFSDDHRLVLVEAAIDGLSHAVVFPDARTRYGSIGGKVSPSQPALITAEAAVMPAHSLVVAAMDNDADGRKLAEVVREAVKLTGRSDLGFEKHEPVRCKDWNDQLRGNVLPAARASSLDLR